MTVNQGLRALAGIVIMASAILAYFISPYWLILNGFVGLNLLQSAFTDWCPAMVMFRKMGLKE
ncbi:MAG: DUF2892 domain-containing protein [Acidobacteria bacterium CG_4_9_14_3_um_filter_49_7]|nr:MAG: DUF2892 domain-containing protein [Acidobacteria bacterium CG_4_9_14_3_um_filter_49_7]